MGIWLQFMHHVVTVNPSLSALTAEVVIGTEIALVTNAANGRFAFVARDSKVFAYSSTNRKNTNRSNSGRRIRFRVQTDVSSTIRQHLSLSLLPLT